MSGRGWEIGGWEWGRVRVWWMGVREGGSLGWWRL